MHDILKELLGFGDGPTERSPRSARHTSRASSRSTGQGRVDFDRMWREADRELKKATKREAKRAARNTVRAANSWSNELFAVKGSATRGLFDWADDWGLRKPVQNHLTSRKGGDRRLEDRLSEELRDFFGGDGWKA